jgi:hypothetical protein
MCLRPFECRQGDVQEMFHDDVDAVRRNGSVERAIGAFQSASNCEGKLLFVPELVFQHSNGYAVLFAAEHQRPTSHASLRIRKSRKVTVFGSSNFEERRWRISDRSPSSSSSADSAERSFFNAFTTLSAVKASSSFFALSCLGSCSSCTACSLS